MAEDRSHASAYPMDHRSYLADDLLLQPGTKAAIDSQGRRQNTGRRKGLTTCLELLFGASLMRWKAAKYNRDFTATAAQQQLPSYLWISMMVSKLSTCPFQLSNAQAPFSSEDTVSHITTKPLMPAPIETRLVLLSSSSGTSGRRT